MTFDTDSGLHLPTADDELDQRLRRLGELGLGAADAEFDAFATDLAHAADVPYAMVNLITSEQFFAGLASPSGHGEHVPVGRSMDRDHGYCPEVLARRTSLVLPDVYASPRFASNPVVDKIGIRTYAGAPLIDEHSDTVLGTVCFVGTEPRPLAAGRATLALINARRDALMELIYQRTSHTTPH